MITRKGKRARAYPAGLDVLRAFVTYDPDHGTIELTNAMGDYRTVPRMSATGYTVIKLPHDLESVDRGRRETNYYRADHIAWALATGEWPAGWIEHINGVLHDNALENLVHYDADGYRWWCGEVVDDDGVVTRQVVRVEDDPVTGDPAVDIVTVRGNDGSEEVQIKPRIAGGWVQRAAVHTEDIEPSIEPAGDYEKGEFGVDWT